MEKHVTVYLNNLEDFESVIRVLRAERIQNYLSDTRTLTVECCMDELIISMVKLYLHAKVHYHAPGAVGNELHCDDQRGAHKS